MKTLPKYFVIEKDLSNPLWKKYIQWLKDTYDASWGGKMYAFYGYEGSSIYTKTNCFHKLEHFRNNPVLITLKEWDDIVNPKEFVLPEKWCIKWGSLENFKIIQGYLNNKYPRKDPWLFVSPHHANAYVTYNNDYWGSCNTISRGYTEITFEEFKKFVLKQDIMKTKEEQLKELQETINLAKKQIEELQKQPEPLKTIEDCYNKVNPVYYVDSFNDIGEGGPFSYDKEELNQLPSRKHCEQLQAIAKCMVVMEALNDGWKPDWKNAESKYRWEFLRGDFIRVDSNYEYMYSLFYFKSAELAKQAYTILGEETIKTAMGL